MNKKSAFTAIGKYLKNILSSILEAVKREQKE